MAEDRVPDETAAEILDKWRQFVNIGVLEDIAIVGLKPNGEVVITASKGLDIVAIIGGLSILQGRLVAQANSRFHSEPWPK